MPGCRTTRRTRSGSARRAPSKMGRGRMTLASAASMQTRRASSVGFTAVMPAGAVPVAADGGGARRHREGRRCRRRWRGWSLAGWRSATDGAKRCIGERRRSVSDGHQASSTTVSRLTAVGVGGCGAGGGVSLSSLPTAEAAGTCGPARARDGWGRREMVARGCWRHQRKQLSALPWQAMEAGRRCGGVRDAGGPHNGWNLRRSQWEVGGAAGASILQVLRTTIHGQ